MLFSSRRNKQGQQFDKTYAAVAAIRHLTSSLRGEAPDRSSPDTIAHWKDAEHRKIEAKRLQEKATHGQRIHGEKVLARYGERFLFAERSGRTKSNRQRAPRNVDKNYYLEPRDLFKTCDLTSEPHDQDDSSKELLPLLRTLVPESASSSKIRTLLFDHDSILNEDGFHINDFSSRNCYDHYQPLPNSKWFRLLIVEPGDFNDVLVCQLAVVQRDVAALKYETLSYSWHNGQRGLYGSIMCSGRLMPVTSNLQLALHHIRRRDRPRILWIDALCINQSNQAERSEQVQIMDSIYAQSFKTLVWLGQADNSVARGALDRVCELVDAWQGSPVATYRITDAKTGEVSTHGFDHAKIMTQGDPYNDLSTLFNSDETRTGEVSTRGSENTDEVKERNPWNDLRILFSSDWFQRQWVIQEVVNSGSLEVLWGSSIISWAFIGIAAAILRTQHNRAVEKLEMFNVYNAYLMFRLRPQGVLEPLRPTFLELLRLTGHFKTSEVLDRFYALLGICAVDNIPGVRPILTANYSLKYETVIEQLIKKLLQGDRPLSFLSEVSFKFHRLRWNSFGRGMGSWIPSWRGHHPSLLSPWDLDQRFASSKGLPFVRHTYHGLSELDLAVNGIIFSTILWIEDLSQDWATNARSILRLLDSGAFGAPSTEILSIISYTIRGGRDAYGSREDSNDTYLEHFADLLCTSVSTDHVSSFLDIARSIAHKGSKDEFILAAGKVCTNRSIFVTIGGHFGLCPYTTLAGDVVAVLGGGGLPVVLGRIKQADKSAPEPNHLDAYEFVGECFMRDVLNGEVVHAAEKCESHRGSLNPALLLEKLYDLSPLVEMSQNAYKDMKKEILLRAGTVYEKLKVQVIDII